MQLFKLRDRQPRNIFFDISAESKAGETRMSRVQKKPAFCFRDHFAEDIRVNAGIKILALAAAINHVLDNNPLRSKSLGEYGNIAN